VDRGHDPTYTIGDQDRRAVGGADGDGHLRRIRHEHVGVRPRGPWYSILDSEWPALRAALDRWLAPDNFARDGAQIRTLESFRQAR
jgi:hypothetical protein